jgi:hypothetical protein
MRAERQASSEPTDDGESDNEASASEGLTPQSALSEVLSAHPEIARDLAVLWEAPVDGILPSGDFTPSWRDAVGEV